jgi:hypothetical protein
MDSYFGMSLQLIKVIIMNNEQRFIKEQGGLHNLTYRERINILLSKGFTKDEAYGMTSEQLKEWTDPIDYSSCDNIPF